MIYGPATDGQHGVLAVSPHPYKQPDGPTSMRLDPESLYQERQQSGLAAACWAKGPSGHQASKAMQVTMNKAPGTAAVQRPSATAWYIVSTEIAVAKAMAMETHSMVSSNMTRSSSGNASTR